MTLYDLSMMIKLNVDERTLDNVFEFLDDNFKNITKSNDVVKIEHVEIRVIEFYCDDDQDVVGSVLVITRRDEANQIVEAYQLAISDLPNDLLID